VITFLEHLLVFMVHHVSDDAIAQPLDAQSFAAEYLKFIRLILCARETTKIITPASNTVRLIVAVHPNVAIAVSSMLNLSPIFVLILAILPITRVFTA
jgi:hypothetical protein